MCAAKGFKIISPKGIPTGRATTLDLTWANHTAKIFQPASTVTLNNHSSDHQPILTKLMLESGGQTTPKKWAMNLRTLKEEDFKQALEERLTSTPPTRQLASQRCEHIASTILEAANNQGRWIAQKSYHKKPWWNTNLLNPLVKARNAERREMLKHKSPETRQSYYRAQEAFRAKVEELKKTHWFIKDRDSCSIDPLQSEGGELTSEVEQMAAILFKGTSEIQTECDAERESCMDMLPNQKAAGLDRIPNKTLKIAKTILAPHLAKAFNECLQIGEFPNIWKVALTAILKKAAKEDYSNPNSYRPIALLSTLGKIFERLINDRLVHWAEKTDAIAQGHMGGRRGRNINDALVLFTTWIKAKWREGKTVTGVFLDVKSAYPTVHKERLLHTLQSKGAPAYLVNVIVSFLSDRHTKIKLNDFVSNNFPIEQGLPPIGNFVPHLQLIPPPPAATNTGRRPDLDSLHQRCGASHSIQMSR
ncbi:hypothetical protein O181_061879 [Austropuccinia psidii MF-1]|uniref:Reverse transcriptase domain-containing protein n=1 Tax=Austropuccinia psidii MF-1 TaxID=1389203 RepID=A0A9Q3EJ31_9BASI|nr:hypothetical protein [Austropuccinia psidii MF-1]